MQRGFIAFDTETTGVDVASERIVTAAAVVFMGGEETESREWLIKVDVDIPERATEVHGITNEISQNQGLDQREALADIRSFWWIRVCPLFASTPNSTGRSWMPT